MDSIVSQLQSDALDTRQDTGMLLRKAYLVSKKLGLFGFERWVSSELNGYEANDKLPVYRNIKGTMKFNNPYHGWCPVLFDRNDFEQSVTVVPLRDSIPKILDLISRKGNAVIPISPEMMALITTDPIQAIFEHAIILDNSSLVNIVELVRTKILEWAIVLEMKGIVGDGLSFSKDEIKSAEDPKIVHYTNNFYSSVSETQIQQGSDSSKQTLGGNDK